MWLVGMLLCYVIFTVAVIILWYYHYPIVAISMLCYRCCCGNNVMLLTLAYCYCHYAMLLSLAYCCYHYVLLSSLLLCTYYYHHQRSYYLDSPGYKYASLSTGSCRHYPAVIMVTTARLNCCWQSIHQHMGSTQPTAGLEKWIRLKVWTAHSLHDSSCCLAVIVHDVWQSIRHDSYLCITVHKER